MSQCHNTGRLNNYVVVCRGEEGEKGYRTQIVGPAAKVLVVGQPTVGSGIRQVSAVILCT